MGVEQRNMQLYEQGSGGDRSRMLVEKWQGLTESIGDPHTRTVISHLLENQVKDIENFNQRHSLNEATFSSNTGGFQKYILPLLLKVFPNLIANKLVSIQPMNAPYGAVFYYDYTYEDSKGRINKNDSLIKTFSEYYSSEYIDYEVVDDGTTAANPAALASSDGSANPLTWLPVHPKNDGKGYQVIFTFLNNTSSNSETVSDDGAGNLVHQDGTTVGTINYDTGAWEIDLASIDGGGGGTFTTGEVMSVTYSYQHERVDEDLAGTGQRSAIPELGFNVSQSAIEAKRRSMKFNVSSDAIDDLSAYHGKEAESELVTGMANQMALGLDREVIGDLINGAKWTADWQHGPNFGGEPVHGELDSVRSLYTVFNAVSAAILKGSKRGHANFIVASPDLVGLIDQLSMNHDFQRVNKAIEPDVPQSYGQRNSQFGVQRVGTLLNKFQVFEDPFLDPNTALMGFKGSSYLDAGYVLAPFVPIEMTPTFVDPDTLRFKKGAKSRYATKMLRPEFYGVVNVSGMTLANVAG